MKVELIQPYHPSASVKQFGKVYMNPLTIPIVAGLIPPEVEVSVSDENVRPIDFNKKVDLVFISSMTPAASRAYEIADNFRQRGIKVVLGGVHPTLMSEEASSHADAVVLGEAEGVMKELLYDFQNGGLKKFYANPIKPDLKNLPRPRRHLMNSEDYVNIPKVETSRGCPFDCTFCSTTTFFGRQMRYRPVEEVVQEVKELNTKFVFFTDNNIVGNPKYAKKLFRALIPSGIKWISQGSLNLTRDLELLELAAKSGCIGMLIGFESLAEKTIAAVGKKVNKVKEYVEAVKRLHAHGIGLIGCFVFGFDEDDKGIFKRTVKFIKRLNIEAPQFTVLTPYPGTALRKKLEEAGRILHNRWEKYDATHVVFLPKSMSPKELRKKYNYACKKVYSHLAILKRCLKSLFYSKSWYKAFVFWQINLVYRKLFRLSLGEKF